MGWMGMLVRVRAMVVLAWGNGFRMGGFVQIYLIYHIYRVYIICVCVYPGV